MHLCQGNPCFSPAEESRLNYWQEFQVTKPASNESRVGEVGEVKAKATVCSHSICEGLELFLLKTVCQTQWKEIKLLDQSWHANLSIKNYNIQPILNNEGYQQPSVCSLKWTCIFYDMLRHVCSSARSTGQLFLFYPIKLLPTANATYVWLILGKSRWQKSSLFIQKSNCCHFHLQY